MVDNEVRGVNIEIIATEILLNIELYKDSFTTPTTTGASDGPPGGCDGGEHIYCTLENESSVICEVGMRLEYTYCIDIISVRSFVCTDLTTNSNYYLLTLHTVQVGTLYTERWSSHDTAQ